jgi:sugar O-acyltransferase (sialic acid O-acetyltransferase NeuD family)
MANFIIFGSGGHARVIAEMLPRDYSPIFLENENVPEGITLGIIGVGDNILRKKIAEKVLAKYPAFEFATIVSKTAFISPSAKLGVGSVVMPHSIIHTSANIGKHCIVNTAAVIEHDNTFGDYSSIASNAATGGDCVIGELAFIGLGASVKHGITIGKNSLIGVGAAVVKDVAENTIVIGTPAVVLRTRALDERFF